MQVNILVTQGWLTTALALLFALVPAVSNAYWIFMTITTSVYLLVYLWLFVSAYRLRKLRPDHPRGYRAPALPLLCAVGFVSSTAAIAISFGPPVAVRQRQPVGVRRDRRRRHAHPGPADPAGADQDPQTELAGVGPERGVVVSAEPGTPTGTLSDPTPAPPHGTRSLYWIVAGVIVALLAVMLITYQYGKATGAAEAKAQQLISTYQRAGLPAPASAENVAHFLGEDGGIVCAAAGSEQALNFLKTELGVGGAFYTRAVIQDRDVLQGLRLIVQVYCPQNLPTVDVYLSRYTFG